MLRYMLDSDFCIELLRDKTPELRQRFNEDSEIYCLSTVVVQELLYGAAKSARPDHHAIKVEEFTARLQVLDFDHEAAAHAGEIRANLAKRGCPIGAYDVLIAGHARSLGLTVFTGNLREFSRVEGLRSESWR
ncbi:MAG: type II toxin-antitoxin system VapC family toxin [Novosphingobium sp.]